MKALLKWRLNKVLYKNSGWNQSLIKTHLFLSAQPLRYKHQRAMSPSLNCASGQREKIHKPTATVRVNGFAETAFTTTKNTRDKRILDLISTPFVDPYVPPHQLGPDHVIPTDTLWTSSPDGAIRLNRTLSGRAAKPPESVVSYFRRQVTTNPHKLALSVKRDGQWLRWTYADYWQEVTTVAKAFIRLGLDRFHAVSVIGFNAPEWFMTNIASMFAGGLAVGIYTTSSSDACKFVVENSNTQIIVVENELQLQKILHYRDDLTNVKWIVQYSGEPTVAGVISWKDLLSVGESVSDEILDKRIRSLAINQCCSIIYTSGTTGNPKGVMLSHDNIVYGCEYIISDWQLPGKFPTHLSYLPLSHVAAQLADIYVMIGKCAHVIFPEPEVLKGKLIDALKETPPSYFYGVPRIYEKMHEKFLEKEHEMGPLKRAILNWTRKRVLQQVKHSFRSTVPIQVAFFDRVMLKRIYESLGLQKVSMFIGGGAPMSQDTLEFFLSLGIMIEDCYGLSESTGPTISNKRNNFRIGCVGKKNEFYEVKINKPDLIGHGELCVRGRHVFMGYLNMDEETDNMFTDGNWLRTGDVGCFDIDGFLYITGRIKELLITAGGENVAPVPIEDRVKSELPIISQAVLIADKKKYLSILLTLKTETDLNTMTPLDNLTPGSKTWCQSIGSSAKTVKDVVQGPDQKVMAAIQKGIDRVNEEAISNAQRIQKWAILPEDLSVAKGELGPTMKMKRPVIMEKYAETIDNLYNIA